MHHHRPHRSLLVLPGWADAEHHLYTAIAQSLTPLGWAVRRANLPDSSWSDARLAEVTRDDTLRQAIEDYDRLADRPGNGPVGVLGFSYGGYMAALLSAQRPVDFLVLRAPALYPDDGWLTPKDTLDKEHVARFRQLRLAPANNRALQSCAAFRGDVLLIEGEEDEIIPPMVLANYGRAFPFAKSFSRHALARSDHRLSNGDAQEAYRDIVVSWLQARAGDGR